MSFLSPLVSIGLPVYNGEKSLRKSIEGLLKQDYKNIELIISDNASTDTTPIICKEYVRKDHRIKYYRNSENIGGSRNFCRVFELSNGKYFMWAAHDDMYNPTYIRKCVEKLETHPEAIKCLSHINLVNQNGLPHRRGQIRVRGTINEDIEQRIKKFEDVWFPYGLYRKDSLNQTRLFMEEFGADVIFSMEVILRGEVVAVDELLMTYRIDQNKKIKDLINSFTTDVTKRKLMSKKPYSQLLKNLYQTIKISEKSERVKQKLLNCFLQVFLSPNYKRMRIAIKENRRLLGNKIKDYNFIFNLFTTWFNSSLTLEEVYNSMNTSSLKMKKARKKKKNPLSKLSKKRMLIQRRPVKKRRSSHGRKLNKR